MKHLTDEQLSARLDGALPAKAAEAAERHLAGCAACRERLAAFAGADESLARALDRDPGDAYFDSFAARVRERIAAGAPAARETAGATPKRGWLSSPRVLAWAGSAAALVVVGTFAIQFAWQRPAGRPATGTPSVTGVDRGGQAAPGARGPAAEGAPTEAPSLPGEASAALEAETAPAAGAAREEPAAAPPVPARDEAAPRAVAPQRLQEVRTLPSGEQVTVRRQELPKSEARPVAAPPADASRPPKPMAVPMAPRAEKSKALAAGERPEPRAGESLSREAAPAPQLATGVTRADADEAAGHRVCGTVANAQGRPLAGATVTVVESGRSVTSADDGSFCVDAPVADATLSVLALGYREYRGRAAGGTGLTAVVLKPVDTLGPGGAPVARLKTAAPPGGQALGGTETPGGARAPGLPEIRGAMDRAGVTDIEVMRARAESKAARFANSAAQWAKAGSLWTHVAMQRLDRDAAEARWMAAEARVNAWRLEPVALRRLEAEAACEAFLRVAPAGARRDSVAAWQRALAAR